MDSHKKAKKEDGSFLIKYFLSGLAGSMSTFVTNPVDVVKVQMQVAKGALGERPNMIKTGTNLYKQLGITSFWRGYPAAVMRSFSFTATRVTAFEFVKKAIHGDDRPGLLKTAIAGTTSGVFASVLANPMELVKVRMQATASQHSTVFHAFRDLVASEGLQGLAKGIRPHAMRGAVNNAAQLGSYDYIKHALLHHGVPEGVPLQFGCSMIAGLIATTTTSPFDVVKTQMMLSTGTGASPGVVQALSKLYARDGVAGLFRGWTPNYARIGPQSVITLLLLEKLRALFGQGNL